jgi:hypothetical protein
MMKKYLCAIFLLFAFNSANWAVPSVSREAFFTSSQFYTAEKFYRTELYFGMNKPDGGSVSEEDWKKFLDDEVTPKFPGGFTVLESYGQYKDKAGRIVKEKSRVLILLFSKKTKATVESNLEAVREAYKKAFQQESVMRMDIPQTVRVSF